jgi:hypothetical protein
VHPEYAAGVARWAYARDHYTGAVVETGKVQRYLIRKASGENAEAYKERCALADYTNHFATVADSLVGMMGAVEANANRIFNTEEGVGLGDPLDADTPIGRLWRSADPDGHGYLTIFKRLATELVTLHTAWVMVDSVDGDPQIRILPATAVPNWRFGRYGLEEALIVEEIDVRQSLQQVPVAQSRYVHLTLEGWQRYRLSENGVPIALADMAAGDFGRWYFEDPNGRRQLPLFRVVLPMRREVGYQLARKANAIFNRESERDHLLRTANFPKLVLAAADNLFTTLIGDLTKGANVLQEDPGHAGGGHRYIAPETGPASVAGETLKRKVEEFYVTAAREYGDAAQQRTATEVRQDVSTGVGAFLQHLRVALDDAENAALWRIEQVLKPNDRNYWYIANVERSEDFLPADPETVLKRQAAMAFGEGRSVPLGKKGMLAVARQVAAYQGIAIDDAELEAAVEVRGILDVLQQTADLDLPALARVELAMKLLAANGMIDPDAEVEMAEGEKRSLGEVLREQALRLAEARDEARRREAELVTPPFSLPTWPAE